MDDESITGSGRRRYDIRVGWLLRPLFTVLGAPRRWDVVVVDATTVRVRLGWLFRTTLDRSAITRARRHRNVYVGWGAHGWRGRWLVNGSSKHIVELELAPRQRAWLLGVWPLRLRSLLLSLVDPDALLADLGVPGDPASGD